MPHSATGEEVASRAEAAPQQPHVTVEDWEAIARRDAARRAGVDLSRTPHSAADAEVASRAKAAPQQLPVTELSFAEMCNMLRLPPAETKAGPGEARAKPAAVPKAPPQPEAGSSRPSWWTTPKAQLPKPPPGGWAPPVPVVSTQEAEVARAMVADWGAAGVPPSPTGATQLGYLAQTFKAPPPEAMQQEQRRPKQSQHQRTVSFAEVNCLRDVVGRGWWAGEFVASELEGRNSSSSAGG